MWRFPPDGDLTAPSEFQRYSGWRRIVLKVVPGRFIEPARVCLTRVLMATRRQRQLQVPVDGLALHLACGEHHVDGWLNIDLVGSRADMFWDLRKRLPVKQGTVRAIFHEHFIEHLPLADAVQMLTDCHGLLRPGGVLRIGVPDFQRHFRSYIESDGFLEQIRPGRPSPLFALNELIYSYGHTSLWDPDTFRIVLNEIGFAEVQVKEFGQSVLAPAPDLLDRQFGTLYIEAIKTVVA
jgi:hypothetical protein